MSGNTHASAGLAAGLAVTAISGAGFDSGVIAGLCWAVAGSLFPDLDQPRSKGNKIIAKVLPFVLAALCLCVFVNGNVFSLGSKAGLHFIGIVSILLLAFFCKTRPHREFSHSLVAMAAGSLCSALCGGIFSALMFGVGYASHLVLDLLNGRGESLLYPSRQKFCLRLCASDGKANKALGFLFWCFSVLIFAGGVLWQK